MTNAIVLKCHGSVVLCESRHGLWHRVLVKAELDKHRYMSSLMYCYNSIAMSAHH